MTPFFDRPRLLMTLTTIFWAGNFVLGRAIAGHVPPITLACLRWTLATLIFLPFAWAHLKRDGAAIREHWAILLFLGAIGAGAYNTLSYIGLTSTEALNGLVLNAAGPMFIALSAWALFGDRIGRLQIVGLASGFAGVLIVIAKGDLASLASFRFNPGDVFIISSMLSWAIYTACVRLRPSISWQSFNFVTYAVAAVGNAPLMAWEWSAGYRPVWDEAAVAAIIYVSIFPSILAYVFYNRSVELMGPANTGLFLFLVPVLGALLATLALGEQLHLFHAAGFALIVAGVLLGTRKKREAVAVKA
ncbi:DMT family transporter [Rhodomicrobium sp.]|uniref:DMT family transporter n=1 Tax=Rhodomicrobium sp. TaxID=2720632 RepID=UPI0039E66BA7